MKTVESKKYTLLITHGVPDPDHGDKGCITHGCEGETYDLDATESWMAKTEASEKYGSLLPRIINTSERPEDHKYFVLLENGIPRFASSGARIRFSENLDWFWVD